MVSVEDLLEAAWARPHPVDNSILLPLLMCVAAGRNGHRVMLNGVSGDLTMGAPPQYIAHLIRGGAWKEAWHECRAASVHHTALKGMTPLHILFSNGAAAFAPRYLKLAMRRLRESRSGSPIENSLVNPDFARKLNLSERLENQIRSVPTAFDLNIRQHHVRAINSYQSGIVLGLTGYERVAGRYGVELRDPWADKRVVEFFVSLPLKYKVRDGWTKFLPRTTFTRELDKKVLYRTGKEHLGRYFRDRLILESQEIIERLSGVGFHVAAEYFDQNKFRKRFDNFKTICARNAASRTKNGMPALQASDMEAQEVFYMLDMIFEIAWLERIRHLG
jgi:asparagine synthase (glutamine-hydrolysing)